VPIAAQIITATHDRIPAIRAALNAMKP
jgi:hypothetical protein